MKSLSQLVFVWLFVMSLMVSTIPKGSSLGGAGVAINIVVNGGVPPFSNDKFGAAPEGYLMDTAPIPVATPPLIAGPGAAAPPFGPINLVLPPIVGPLALFQWTNRPGGIVQPGVPPNVAGADIHILVPDTIWDATGAAFGLVGVTWGAGVGIGQDITVPPLVVLNFDGDPEAESYWKFYIDDPGYIEFQYTRKSAPVGGVVVSIDKLGLLIPYIGVGTIVTISAVVTLVIYRRRKEE